MRILCFRRFRQVFLWGLTASLVMSAILYAAYYAILDGGALSQMIPLRVRTEGSVRVIEDTTEAVKPKNQNPAAKQATSLKTTTKTPLKIPSKAPMKTKKTVAPKTSDERLLKNAPTAVNQKIGIKTANTSSVPASPSSVRYLVYVCDSTVYCYGMGDRQRAMVGLQVLASVTNRKLVINMSYPAPLRDFYKPNLIDWDIPKSQLEGKSSTEIKLLGPQEFLPNAADFNKIYPQDVVYFRTNHFFYDMLKRSARYKNLIPQMPRWKVYATIWTQLMTPTENLRSPLNKQLVDITQAILSEFDAYSKFNVSICNQSKQAHKNNRSNTTSPASTISKKTINQSNADGNDRKNTNESLNFCEISPPQIKPSISLDAIRKLTGHDLIDLGLICIHIRMGDFQKQYRNNPKTLSAVWKFLQPYVAKGHHIYLSTDSQEVRDEGKARLGHRLHVSLETIVHVGSVRGSQDGWQGTRLAFMEQLLLTTSCRVLVVSYSNFSMKPAMVRALLQGETGNLFIFKKGKVSAISASRLI